jgi:hypothetical protein
MKRTILWIVGVGLVVFLLIQFIPIERTNPPVTREVKWDSQETRALAQRACFDCHSNETVRPWYAYVAPVSLLLAKDMQEGRSQLNFSEWDKTFVDVREIAEVIESGYMPLPQYLLMHPEAKLTDAEKQQLITGLEATFEQDPPGSGQ